MQRIVASLLVVSILLSFILAGCSTAAPSVDPTETQPESDEATNVTETTTELTEPEVTEPQTEPETEPPAVTEPEPSFTPEQQNSINMLNHLIALVTEIIGSSGNRMYLEEVYLDLQNNTDPSMVDNRTLGFYNKLLYLLDNCRMTAVKRERLSYLYDQNRANNLRSAMPSPVSVLNVVESEKPLQAVASLLYLAVDSVSSYHSSTSALDTQYLQDNWNLEDREARNLHDCRTEMFNYLVQICDEYDIPGTVTLNEEYATEFVKWKKNSNIAQRIHWLEQRVDTYRFFGEYWLALAESYYLDSNYEKCLDAIAEYESLNIAIYRIDYRYAQVLPYVILSAKEVMAEDAYVEFASRYVALLQKHASQYDWASQYFVCQTYMELYTITKDVAFLQQAYDIALSTASYLAQEQETLNTAYFADLEITKADKNASERDKQKIEQTNAYTEYLMEIRKTQLPPVYEPLRLFCELLFGLVDELDLSAEQRQKAENILREESPDGGLMSIFLDRSLDNLYRFDLAGFEFSLEDVAIEFDGKRITIPAQYISGASHIVLTVNGDTVSDWCVKEVNRNKSENIEDFIVTFTSETVRERKFAEGDVVTIEVYPYTNADSPMRFSFDVEKGFLNLTTEFVRK